MSELLPVLHEDGSILAVAKPAGMCVIPARTGDPADCVRARLEEARGTKIFVVHRLDRDTSGVVVFAKTAEAHRALNDAFAARLVHKTYLALVAGSPSAAAGTIDLSLHEGRKGRMRVASPGEPGSLSSETRFRVLEQFSSRERGGATVVASLIELAPLTGRTHQPRVHASASGFPILGDPIYAPAHARALAPRLMLHASRLELPDLSVVAARVIDSPLPDDFIRARHDLARAP